MVNLEPDLPICTDSGEVDYYSYASEYIEAATSDNTRQAYQSDIQHFQEKVGPLPATPDQVEAYLRLCAQSYNPRTLQRRLTALRQWHKLQQCPDPTDHPLVQKTMRGIARLHGKPKHQAAALKLVDLDQLIGYLTQIDTPQSVRNRALLLLGFFGALRCSELVSLNWEQIAFVADGMIVKLIRSKTDQTGEGTDCIIPFGNAKRCPVRHLLDWRDKSRQFRGPIFRRISKTGTILEQGISTRYWNYLIKSIAEEAKLTNADQISSHSLRRGFATEAARLGAPMAAIQRHGRWRCTRTVLEYIEAGRQFSDSAVNVLFEY